MNANRDPLPPTTYPNPRNDDPWDHDAVQWLLLQDRNSRWTRGSLFEALRRQSHLERNRPDLLADASRLASRYGVRQIDVARGTGQITRIVRTDPGAPKYPSDRA